MGEPPGLFRLLKPMQKPPHQHFGFGILPPNAAHIKTTYRLGVYIGHGAKVGVKQLHQAKNYRPFY